MRKGFLLVTFFMGLLLGHTQKDIYTSKNFDEYAKDHEVLAILPFKTALRLDDGVEEEKLRKLKEKEGLAVQNALESYFLKRKKRKKFSVEFQDAAETNALLKQKGVTYENLDTYTPKELSKLLGVDGIIGGTLIISTLISEEVDEPFDLISLLRGKSDFGKINIKIADGPTGKLLWKYTLTINRRSGKNTEAIIDKMMRKAARKFPYDREHD